MRAHPHFHAILLRYHWWCIPLAAVVLLLTWWLAPAFWILSWIVVPFLVVAVFVHDRYDGSLLLTTLLSVCITPVVLVVGGFIWELVHFCWPLLLLAPFLFLAGGSKSAAKPTTKPIPKR